MRIKRSLNGSLRERNETSSLKLEIHWFFRRTFSPPTHTFTNSFLYETVKNELDTCEEKWILSWVCVCVRDRKRKFVVEGEKESNVRALACTHPKTGLSFTTASPLYFLSPCTFTPPLFLPHCSRAKASQVSICVCPRASNSLPLTYWFSPYLSSSTGFLHSSVLHQIYRTTTFTTSSSFLLIHPQLVTLTLLSSRLAWHVRLKRKMCSCPWTPTLHAKA